MQSIPYIAASPLISTEGSVVVPAALLTAVICGLLAVVLTLINEGRQEGPVAVLGVVSLIFWVFTVLAVVALSQSGWLATWLITGALGLVAIWVGIGYVRRPSQKGGLMFGITLAVLYFASPVVSGWIDQLISFVNDTFRALFG
ncbi:hypothetical protein FJZ39_03695 [Candidatus Saccharibacteria bacterium]|nr:hypothetical protein [Candidatus Saccharibacteria bacterium]